MSDRRTNIALVIALSIHAGVWFFVLPKSPELYRAGLRSPFVRTVEIDLAALGSSPTAARPEASPAHVVTVVSPRKGAFPAPSTEASEPSRSEPIVSEAPLPAPSLTPRLSLSALGVGQSAPYVGPRRPERRAPLAEVAARAVEKSINDELAARD